MPVDIKDDLFYVTREIMRKTSIRLWSLGLIKNESKLIGMKTSFLNIENKFREFYK